MAERPVFLPSKNASGFVKEVRFDFPWAPGFAVSQKQKNVRSLRAAAASAGYAPLLEVSSKSEETVGRDLSAFHLEVASPCGDIPLECAFQGSKVFESGGPYVDLYSVHPREAKRDPRLQASGRLIGFEFDGHKFPLQPTTVFYDWLYLTSIFPHRGSLQNRLDGEKPYAGFTDIEFNPSKSINCQAKSCALFVALMQMGMLEDLMVDPDTFVGTMSKHCTGRTEIKTA